MILVSRCPLHPTSVTSLHCDLPLLYMISYHPQSRGSIDVRRQNISQNASFQSSGGHLKLFEVVVMTVQPRSEPTAADDIGGWKCNFQSSLSTVER